MRRHTLDPDSIRKQIKSVFTSPTRKFFNFTNGNHSDQRTRRFSVPEKKQSDRSDNTNELDTIQENEANSAGAGGGGGGGGVEQTDINRSQSSNKSNTDSSSKLSRIQAVFASKNDKKTNTVLTDSVGGSSHTTNNTSGPGGGANSQRIDGYEQPIVAAALSQHTNTATPVASLGLPSGKCQLTNTTSSSSTAKQFLTGRVRSRSKTDAQSVSDKSLFSRIFSKKSKKPMGTLITTTTKSIDLDINKKRSPLVNKTSLTVNEPRSTIDEEDERGGYGDDDDDDERNISTGSLSDTEHHDEDNDVHTDLSSNKTRGGNRANSGKSTNAPSTGLSLPSSDSQYYASMSSAPTGFSISYHKRMTKGNDDLRLQAALGRLQQQNKKGAANSSGGASQLMSLFQEPKRSGAQSPTPMSGTTRVKTQSGQTIITRNSSASDRPSTYVIRSSSISPTNDADETFINDDEIYTHFMKCHTCYDIMPKSSKLVVFDTQLVVKKAFFALVYNGVRAAPLWDTKRQKFIGLLTITDFILILQKYYKEPHAKIEELEQHRIETWRDVLKEYEKPLLYIRPPQNLYEAVRILLENHVHRLPIIDPITNNVIFILTHKRILRFFYLYFYDWPQPSFMSKTLEELNLGTYDNLHIIEENSTVIEALGYFVKYRVSALPVVDKNKKLVNIYSKFDVIGLAADKSYRNLNMTINEALLFRKERFETVAKCYKHELLSICIERIVKAEVHRLVIIDNDERVIGVLSLSDVLYYIVIRPSGKTEDSTFTFKPTTNEEVE